MDGVLRYHETVTSGLQMLVRLALRSPWYAVITVSVDKAGKVAERQLHRYPAIGMTAGTRTALRKVGVPAVQMVIMPVRDGQVSLILLTGTVPEPTREQWYDSRDPSTPLVWGNYELDASTPGSVTWRLSQERRTYYRRRITRIIKGQRLPSGRVVRVPPAVAKAKVEGLARHLLVFPGLRGIRSDVSWLHAHADRQWRSTYPRAAPPEWPYHPFMPQGRSRTKPISQLTLQGEDHE